MEITWRTLRCDYQYAISILDYVLIGKETFGMNKNTCMGTDGVGPIIYMLRRLSLHALLSSEREAMRRSIAFVANCSCKHQARLRSDLTTVIESCRRIKMCIIGLTPRRPRLRR